MKYDERERPTLPFRAKSVEKGGRRRRTSLVVTVAWAKKTKLGPVNKNERYELKVDLKEEPSNRE